MSLMYLNIPAQLLWNYKRLMKNFSCCIIEALH
ncbi:hypothetical protein CAJAP_08945 [Camponotus japonicus]